MPGLALKFAAVCTYRLPRPVIHIWISYNSPDLIELQALHVRQQELLVFENQNQNTNLLEWNMSNFWEDMYHALLHLWSAA